MKLDRIDYNGGEIWVDMEAFITIDEAYIHHGITHNEKEDCYNLYHCHKPTRNIEGRSELFVDGMFAKDCWKVVAQSITNPSYIDGVPFVEVGEDVYSLAELEYPIIQIGFNNKLKHEYIPLVPRKQREAFIEGYKAAQAKQFTEEDLIKAINRVYNYVDGDGWSREYITEQVFKELRPKVDSIEIEMTEGTDDFLGCPVVGEERPMTYQKDGKIFLKIKSIQHV